MKIDIMIVKNAPQWAIVLADIGYVINVAVHHGEPMDRVYDVQTALVAFIFTMWLYYSGGFFDCWKKKSKYRVTYQIKPSFAEYDEVFNTREEAEGYAQALMDFELVYKCSVDEWR